MTGDSAIRGVDLNQRIASASSTSKVCDRSTLFRSSFPSTGGHANRSHQPSLISRGRTGDPSASLKSDRATGSHCVNDPFRNDSHSGSFDIFEWPESGNQLFGSESQASDSRILYFPKTMESECSWCRANGTKSPRWISNAVRRSRSKRVVCQR